MKKLRLGAGSAYWGDMLEPAVEIAKKGNVKYIGFDHLAELTMSILQRQKNKTPSEGYIKDIIPWMKALIPICQPKGIKLITNAGGVNPVSAAEQVAKLASSLGFKGLKIGIVEGDDIYPKLDEMIAKGIDLTNLDTGEKDISKIRDRIIAANVYIGADSIIDALKDGADIVITGRCSDTAVYIGPIMYEFGWTYEKDWSKIAAAVIASHTIECAECATRGYNEWDKICNLSNIGFPILEIDENGDSIIEKVPGSGGVVNEWSVKEQLMYEVHDPENYIMPDGIGDFTSIKLEDLGNDRVKLSNMTGKPRPETLKVQIGYEDGWIGEGQIFFSWPDAYEKAKQAERVIRERFEIVKLDAQEIHFDYIGVNMLHGCVAPEPNYEINEVGLRVAARTKTIEEAQKVGREATHIWTLGGVGTAYGIPYRPRPVITLWPTLVPRSEVKTTHSILEVK